MFRSIGLGLVGAALVGCTSADRQTITGVPNLPGGNPLVPEVALLPWPSDLYLEVDATRTSGRALRIPAEALPDAGWAELLAEADGFSLASPILASFPSGVDAATLPSLAESVTTGASVLLWAEDEELPTLALVEVDATTVSGLQQALIIRPQVGLKPDTAYVVLITDAVRDPAGESLRVTEAFRALRDGIPSDSDEVERLREGFALVQARMEALGLAGDQVRLGWSFHTRSATEMLNSATAMHDAMMRGVQPAWEERSRELDGDQWVIEGSVDVPNFLAEDGRIHLDETGLPLQEGEREMLFTLSIPVTVQETRPLIVFGHGFFSDRTEITWGGFQQSLQAWQMSAISTNFMGFAEEDLIQGAPALAGDLPLLAKIVDQQRQSQAHFTALARLGNEQLSEDVVLPGQAGELRPIDPYAVSYMGISNGGTQGFVIAASSPLLTRSALVVGGGGWSHIVQRATQWNTLGEILRARFPSPVEQQLVLAMMQQVLDPVDAITFAPHVVADRLPGRPPAQVSLHMAVGDCQVSNMTTEWVARAAGVPLVVPTPREVFGLETLTARPPGVDVPSGLIVYDEGYPALPDGNVAPPEDNGAHETLRDLLSYRDSVGGFLETGKLVQACTGACDPN